MLVITPKNSHNLDLTMCLTVFSGLGILTQSSQQLYYNHIGYAIKLRLREVKALIQVHTTNKWKAKPQTQKAASTVYSFATLLSLTVLNCFSARLKDISTYSIR